MNAPVVDHPRLAQGARSIALLARRADAALARTARARSPTSSSRRAPPSCRPALPLIASACSSGAPTPIASARSRPDRRRSCGRAVTTVAVFAGAFRTLARRDPPGRRDRELRARGRDDIGAVLIGDGPELPRVRAEAARGRARSSSPARCRTTRCPRRWPRPTSASRRSTRRARAAVARLLLVAAEDLRVHGRRPAGRRARGRSDSRARRATDAKGCSTIPPGPAALADALARADRSGRSRARWARPRASAPCATTAGRRTAAALDARDSPKRRRGARGARMRILIATDAFPPSLRRQRLEHVRARPRPARARPRGHDRPAAARRTPPAFAKRRTTASRASSSARRRPTCRTCATTSRTSG